MPLPRPTPLQPGAVVDGRYEIVRQLGAGGMGTVFAALDVHLRRRVAVKVMHLDPRNETNAQRFANEAAALAAVRHENVVTVHAYGHAGRAPYYVMELVDGENVRRIAAEHAQHGERLPVRQALGVLASVARALAAIHARGIVHRDVKPANIVVEDATGRAVLVDFGLAVHGAENPDDDLLGTPSFVAPEQIDVDSRERVHPAIDVYGLGCTAYGLLSGEAPFRGTPAEVFDQHLHAERPLLSTRCPELRHLDELLSSMIARSSSARPSALAVARAFEAAAELLAIDPTAIARAASALRVVVVDDDSVFARVAARASQIALGSGTDVIVARSGDEALEEIARSRPDAMILDYRMPGIDGLEVLRRVRSMPGGRSVRVVVASAHVGPHERWRFGLLGVKDFVPKPQEMRELVTFLRDLGLTRAWDARSEDTATQVPGRR